MISSALSRASKYSVPLSAAPSKSIRLGGASVNLASSGAVVDLGGGGGLQEPAPGLGTLLAEVGRFGAQVDPGVAVGALEGGVPSRAGTALLGQAGDDSSRGDGDDQDEETDLQPPVADAGGSVDQLHFLPRMRPPENEHNMVVLARNGIDHSISECFPALALM
mgnify:CR=1 FL=1